MRVYAAAMIIAVASAGAVASQPAPPPPDAIVVIGEPLEKIRDESVAYVRELGIARGSQQAARWVTPICPRVAGIAEPMATKARDQIRAVARSVRAPLAPPGCKANLVVVLTSDPQGFVKMVAKKDSSKLGTKPRRAEREWLFGTAPARWWYDLGIQTRDRSPASSDAGTAVAAEADSSGGFAAQSKSELPGTASTAYSAQFSASRLSTPTVRAIRASTIVVNFEDAHRLGLEAVIDYAALVGLAEIRPGAAPDASILSLFDAGNVRRELSNRDIGFLTALYALPLDREANVQRAALVNIMTNGTGARSARN
jgi:hypothetical protein